VQAWGWNSDGQTTVPVAARSGVTAITAGGYHTVALKTNGSVVAWGNNGEGQTAVPVAAQSGVTAVAAGYGHTVALVIPTAPVITTQPMSQTVNAGQSASFTVVAAGAPLSYQWRKDGTNVSGATSTTELLCSQRYRLLGQRTVDCAGGFIADFVFHHFQWAAADLPVAV
jgi:alpha-tubulin suppressor-like RCC1 family protein